MVTKEEIVERTKKTFAPPTERQKRLQAQAMARGGLTSGGIKRFQKLTPSQQQAEIRKQEIRVGVQDTVQEERLLRELDRARRGVGSFKSETEFRRALALERQLRPESREAVTKDGQRLVSRVGRTGLFGTTTETALRRDIRRGVSRRDLLDSTFSDVEQVDRTFDTQPTLASIRRVITPKERIEQTSKTIRDIEAQLKSGLVNKEKRKELIDKRDKLIDSITSRKPTVDDSKLREIAFGRLAGIRGTPAKTIREEYLSGDLLNRQYYVSQLKEAVKNNNDKRIARLWNAGKELSQSQNEKERKLGRDYQKQALKIGVTHILKTKSPSEIVKYGKDLMKDAKNISYIRALYEKYENKNKTKANTFLKELSQTSNFKKATGLFTIGLRSVAGIPVKKLVDDPFQTAVNVSALILTRGLLKAGIISAKPIVSAITQTLAATAGTAYGVQFAKGLKKAKNKTQYIIEEYIRMYALGKVLQLPKGAKPTFSFKRVLKKLSPFYKDLKLLQSTPRVQTGKELLKQTQRKGEKGNFYHVTSGKYKDFVKDGVLRVLKQKFGAGKDRKKFNEDFLYVSDKGLVEYGLKGTKPLIRFRLGTEASKLFQGSLRKYQSSNLLDKINASPKTKKKGKLKAETEMDNIVLTYAKGKSLVIGGQKATNIQVAKKFSRKTTDWDIKDTNAKKTAIELIKLGNEASPGRYKLQSINTTDGKVYRIFDTKIKEIVVDVGSGKIPKTVNIEGVNFARVDYLVDRKISTLVDASKTKRWEKDLKDLKNLLKATGDMPQYKKLIKQYEKEIFKGEFDPTKAKFIRQTLKSEGLSDKTIDFLTRVEKNPLKYTLLKLVFQKSLQKKPEIYKIMEFENINILKFPKGLINKIKLASENKLSLQQKTKLRKDLVEYINNNPNKAAAGSKTLANFKIPFGLEQEWQIAVGSTFKPNRNIRSAFFNIFGIKKGEFTTYDDTLDRFIPIFRFADPKNNKNKQNMLKELFLLIKNKYKNPKKVIVDALKDEKIKTPSELLKKFERLSPDERRAVLAGIQTGRFRLRKLPRTQERLTLRKSIPKRRKIKIRIAPRRTLTIKQSLPRRIVPRQLKNIRRKIIPRINRIIARSFPRARPRLRNKRIVRQVPKSIIRRNRYMANTIPIRLKKPPLVPKLNLELQERLKKLKEKNKSFEPVFQYTPTLAGIDSLAKTPGAKVFTGFEVRGNIINLKKPITVKKHKRKTLRNKMFVRKHGRKKPKFTGFSGRM